MAGTDPYGWNRHSYEELIAQWIAMPKDGLSDRQRQWARNALLTPAPAWIDDRLPAPRRELRARPPSEDWSDWLSPDPSPRAGPGGRTQVRDD